MKVLIVAATELEIQPLIRHLDSFPSPQAEVLITGVGMIATTYALTKKLRSRTYDLVVQAGVGGSFDRNIKPGDLVFITSDQYGDLGAEDHDNFLDIFELGLLDKNVHPHTGGKLLTPLQEIHKKINLPQVSALTINSVSGSERTIKQRAEKYGCAVESMEGAAFHYVCLEEDVAFAQIRAISNYVIPRDKSQWQMKDAIINLNKWLIGFMEQL